MKKKLALLLAALLLFGSAACGKTDTADDTQQEIQTEFNLPKCGLSYTIPDAWVEMENTNLIPASYVKAISMQKFSITMRLMKIWSR